jgi:hypothetical protein
MPTPFCMVYLMFARRAFPRFPWLATLIYSFTVLLVVSFILFEVLDIDGSDLPVLDAWHWIASAEGAHDLRRGLLAHDTSSSGWISLLVVRMLPKEDHQRRHLTEDYLVLIRIEQHFPVALPRSTLPIG